MHTTHQEDTLGTLIVVGIILAIPAVAFFQRVFIGSRRAYKAVKNAPDTYRDNQRYKHDN